MFGLTRREQRWKAEQKAAETLVELARVVVDARAVDAKVDAEELARLRVQLRQVEEQRDEAARRVQKAEAAVYAALPAMREYARKNPKHHFGERLQDPNGVHAWLEAVGSWMPRWPAWRDRAALTPNAN